jgi:Phage T7 capsid assembly protein
MEPWAMTDPTITAASDDTSAAPAPAAPEGVPAKFWDSEKGAVNVDALLKSYSELERTHSAPVDDTPADHDTAQQAVENAGLDWNELVGKVSTRGGLDDGDYAALGTAGIPRPIVDNYLALVQNENARQTELANQHVGGEARMNELLGWAADHLPPAEIATYNQMLSTRDGWRAALDVITAKMAASSKTAGEPRLSAGVSARSDQGGYTSKAAMLRDMGSPRYQTNPAFRDQVARRMAGARWEDDNR